MKFTPVFFCLFFFLLQARAHIRVVGNGGGLAEMQIYALDQKLASLLQIEIAQSALQGLDSPELKAYKMVSEIYKSGKQKPLVYTLDCLEPSIQFQPEQILISSCELYRNELPRPVMELAQIVFEIRLQEADPVLSAGERHSISDRFFQGFQELDSKSLQLSIDPAIWLRLQNFAQEGHLISLFGFESKEGTADLSATVLAALACPGPVSDWNLSSLELETKTNQEIVVAARAEWTCERQKSRAKVLMIFSQGFSLESLHQNLRLRITQKELLP